MKPAGLFARVNALVLPLAMLALGCGGGSSAGNGNGTGGAGGSAGAAGTGGAPGSGGAAGTGGASSSGGAAGTGGAGGNDAAVDGPAEVAPPVDGGAAANMNMFVTSDTNPTGNLGGVTGADQRCQRLATAVGQCGKTWHAYVSLENPATNAIDRIGEGPYYNVAGAMVAATKAALHMRTGDPDVFLTEKGGKVNGHWAGSPTPNEHDVFTGSSAAGMLLAGLTCGDWTAATGMGQVGHTDGLGPMMNMAANYRPWNSSHATMCGNPGPQGGAGKIVCFVAPP